MSGSPRAPVPRLGAWREGGKVHVRAWAPEHEVLEWILYAPDGRTLLRSLPMIREPGGFFHASMEAGADLLYKIRIDGQGPFPDPWSRAQPFGVHGPSGLDVETFPWRDDGWRGPPLEALVLYELHVGTATDEGTFEALIPRLPELRADGITALELMPVASFPGRWNWGYDGVSWFAPAQVYGGPSGLRALVDAAHHHGLAVLLDVVHNHFGPDGNYLAAHARRYFTEGRHTPWGEAINYDQEGSEVARELALRSAEMWIRDYHLDGLRLDAIHAIEDGSSPHLVRAIADRARAAAPGRHVVIFAEDDGSDARPLTSVAQGGFGLNGTWADDFHHVMRRAFAGDTQGYYAPYAGTSRELVTLLEQGICRRAREQSEVGPPEGWVFFIQNHDQVGNRALGNRLGEDVSPAAFRAMSALLLLAPATPLLFAGQEWNTRTPFLFFTDHEEPLGRQVTEGRRREFKDFTAFHHHEVPDPQAEETFRRSRLDWSERERPGHREVLALYRELLRLRAVEPALRQRAPGSFRALSLGDDALVLERRDGEELLRLYFNLRGRLDAELGGGALLLDTEDTRFGGSGRIEPGERLTFEGPRAVLIRARPGLHEER